MIEREHPELSVKGQCALVSLPRSTFYHEPRGENPFNLSIMRAIDEEFLAHPWTGTGLMVRQLKRSGFPVGPKRIRRLMRLMGLKPIYQAPKTSQPAPHHRVFPYLLRNLTIDAPNQVWCADIT